VEQYGIKTLHEHRASLELLLLLKLLLLLLLSENSLMQSPILQWRRYTRDRPGCRLSERVSRLRMQGYTE